jgi:uncharacterized RDD family membrane protein YckC
MLEILTINSRKKAAVLMATLSALMLTGEILKMTLPFEVFYSLHMQQFYMLLKPLELQAESLASMLFRNNFQELDILKSLFALLLAVAAFMIARSEKGNHILARFLLSAIFACQFVYAVILIGDLMVNLNFSEIAFRLIIVIRSAALLFFTASALRYLNSLHPVDAAFDQKTRSLIIEAPTKGERFAHHVVDNLLAALMFHSIARSIGGWFWDLYPDRSLEKEYLLLAHGITMIPYYFGCEFFLQTTPGKLLTRSRVLSDLGEKPTSRNIFARTFSRKIPFEAFTFLGNTGLHDSLSSTVVAKEKSADTDKSTKNVAIPEQSNISAPKTVKQEVEQWTEFVRTSRVKKITDDEIRLRLERSRVSAEAVEIMLQKESVAVANNSESGGINQRPGEVADVKTEALKWKEFVKVNRENGLSEADIASRLERANVNPEVIALLLNQSAVKSLERQTNLKYLWMLVVGVIKLIVGIPLLLLFLSAGQLSILSFGLVITGTLWIILYRNNKNK